MELTIFLSKVFGLFLIIGGASIMLRQRYFMPVIGGFVHEPMLRMIVGFAELLGGLFLVSAHSIWSSPPAIVVSLVGVLLALEGAMYLLLSDATVERYLKAFNRPSWYTLGGIFAVILGLYLAAYGFGYVTL